MRCTEVLVGLCVLRVYLNKIFIILYGKVELSFIKIYIGEVEVTGAIGWVELKAREQMLLRFFEFILREKHSSEV